MTMAINYYNINLSCPFNIVKAKESVRLKDVQIIIFIGISLQLLNHRRLYLIKFIPKVSWNTKLLGSFFFLLKFIRKSSKYHCSQGIFDIGVLPLYFETVDMLKIP